jgi:hypothetical protein
MPRPVILALAATLALASADARAADSAAITACPADRAALAALLKPLKVETKWDDPESPTPNFRHYKPGSLRVLGLAPNDVFVEFRDKTPAGVTFRFPGRELAPLVPGFQAAYPSAKCTSPSGCGVDPRGSTSRSGEAVMASIAAGDSEFLGATLVCMYRAD